MVSQISESSDALSLPETLQFVCRITTNKFFLCTIFIFFSTGVLIFYCLFHLKLGDRFVVDRATQLQSNLAILAPFFLSAKSAVYRLGIVN